MAAGKGASQMKHWIFTAGLALSTLIVAPAAADDWARDVDGWDVGRDGDSCVMFEEYEGEGSTQLTLVISDDVSRTALMVTNYRWSAKKGERYELKYHLGEWVYTSPSLGIEQDSIRKGFGTMVSSEFLADFAKADGLEITNGDAVVDDLSLKGSAAALAVLERCRRELARDLEQQRRDREKLAHIPVDPFASTTPPQAAGMAGPRDPVPMGTWHSRVGANYPSRAIREGLEGKVEMALAISAAGRVVSCTVTLSSGHAVLDEAACAGAQRYGRFEPALDSEGRPVEGTYSTSITYSLG
jgi:TonB family protein